MKNKKLKILLAKPRGFCAGVERAIEIVKKSIEKYGAPVYVRHEIVHNKEVVQSLKKIGAIFVEELSEISDKSRPVIFSAHGVPKSVTKEAENYKMEFIDATCPLVSKVHREAENHYKAGNHILLIGHKNHPEVIGTMGQIPSGKIDLIETIDDAKKYEIKNEDEDDIILRSTTKKKHNFDDKIYLGKQENAWLNDKENIAKWCISRCIYRPTFGCTIGLVFVDIDTISSTEVFKATVNDEVRDVEIVALPFSSRLEKMK